MELLGKIVEFHLSPEGREALGDLFPASRFEAEVVSVDPEGLWVLVAGEIDPPLRAKLLKWEYFATAMVDYTKVRDGKE